MTWLYLFFLKMNFAYKFLVDIEVGRNWWQFLGMIYYLVPVESNTACFLWNGFSFWDHCGIEDQIGRCRNSVSISNFLHWPKVVKDVNDQATIVITQDNASLDFPLFILTPLLYVSFLYRWIYHRTEIYLFFSSLPPSRASGASSIQNLSWHFTEDNASLDFNFLFWQCF